VVMSNIIFFFFVLLFLVVCHRPEVSF